MEYVSLCRISNNTAQLYIVTSDQERAIHSELNLSQMSSYLFTSFFSTDFMRNGMFVIKNAPMVTFLAKRHPKRGHDVCNMPKDRRRLHSDTKK